MTDVKVTCILPGMVKTEFALVRFKGDRIKADEFYEGRNILSPRHIAEVVGFCVDRPQHVNITTLEISSNEQPFHLGLSKKVK